MLNNSDVIVKKLVPRPRLCFKPVTYDYFDCFYRLVSHKDFRACAMEACAQSCFPKPLLGINSSDQTQRIGIWVARFAGRPHHIFCSTASGHLKSTPQHVHSQRQHKLQDSSVFPSTKDRTCIVWFKNDLRLDDHPGLAAAASYDVVVPVFIFDNLLIHYSSKDFLEAQLSAIADLRQRLQCIGSDLICRRGSLDDVLFELVQEVGASAIITEEEIEERLQHLVSSLSNSLPPGVKLEKWQITLQGIRDMEQVPDSYDKFLRRQFPRLVPLDPPLSLPPVPNCLTRGILPTLEELYADPTYNNCWRRIFQSDTASIRLWEVIARTQKSKSKARKQTWSIWPINSHRRYRHEFLKWKKEEGQNKVSSHAFASESQALAALDAYLQFHEPNDGSQWKRFYQEICKMETREGTSFRCMFNIALNLGTLSRRRVFHKGLAYLKRRSRKSLLKVPNYQPFVMARAAVREAETIEWYRLLAMKSQIQGKYKGWHVKTWKWRGFLVQYTTWGNAGPPLVLLHGFGAFWEHYRDNIKQLGTMGNQVWAVTMLGFGRSEKPNVLYTELLLTELVRDFIIEVVHAPAILVGNSIGGYVISMVACLWPSLVSSLVLLNSAGLLDADCSSIKYLKAKKTSNLGRLSAPLLLWFLQNDCSRMIRRCYPNNTSRADAWLLRELMRASYDPGATAVLESLFHIRASVPLNYLLLQYGGPVLVIQGVRDPLQDASQQSKKLQALCKNVMAIHLDAGHCPHDEVPDDVNEIINQWARRHVQVMSKGNNALRGEMVPQPSF